MWGIPKLLNLGSHPKNAKGHGGTARQAVSRFFQASSRARLIGGDPFLEMIDLLGSE